jgi:metal-dependent amidase/aminoacylase/carboxypeptidase family protein
MTHVEVQYHGRASHAAAAPWAGLNALDAVVTAYNAIGLLRQQIRDSARVHGIITDGGKAPNIIPEFTSARFMVRAEDNDYLATLQERVLECLRAGATATGCEVDFSWAEAPYLALNTNAAIAAAYTDNMSAIGRTVVTPSGVGPASMGSTDMGNVSWAVPSIHPSIGVSPRGVPIHTADFAIFAASEAGDRAIIDGAQALAMTAIDVLTRPDLRDEMRRQFELDKRQPR